jgi:hypothetical protein
MKEIETTVAKLQLLAAKPTLSAAENTEAQGLMRSLKACGMSNPEIAKSAEGKWSVSTVKGYTTGVSALSPSPWQDALAALTDLIAANLTLDQVVATLKVNHSLAANKLTVEDMTGVIQTVAAAGLDFGALINEIKALQQAGLSLKDTAGVTALKTTMESYGLKLAALPALVKIAQQHGDAQQVLEAFAVYASLTALQAEIDAAGKMLEKIQIAQEKASQDLLQTEGQTKILAAPLQAHKKLLEYGFTDKTFIRLSELAENYGGIENVTLAVKKYASLEEIKGKLNEAKSALANIETRISGDTTKYGHLTSAIQMSKTLIADHQYGLDALGTILMVAQKFGEPVAVLKAVEGYGELLSIKTQADSLAGTVTERQQLLAGLEAQFKEALQKLDALNAVALDIGDRSGRALGKFNSNEDLRKLLAIIHHPEQAAYAEHGQVVLMLVLNLRQWVATNEANFRRPRDIKAGLETLVRELGGLS